MTLGAGLQALGLSASLAEPLAAYLQLLAKWNAAYNLTAIRDPEEMVVKHLLDSLVALPFVGVGSLVDVGTGAGLPGLPLAIAAPQLTVTLLDSNNKKTAFCTHAVAMLRLANVKVVHARVEEHRAGPYQAIVSRAFSSVPEFCSATAHLGAAGGASRWLAMKGARPDAELAALPAGFTVRAVHPLTVPGLDAERCLVELARA